MGFGPGVRVRPLEMKHLGCRACGCEPRPDAFGVVGVLLEIKPRTT